MATLRNRPRAARVAVIGNQAMVRLVFRLLRARRAAAGVDDPEGYSNPPPFIAGGPISSSAMGVADRAGLAAISRTGRGEINFTTRGFHLEK